MKSKISKFQIHAHRFSFSLNKGREHAFALLYNQYTAEHRTYLLRSLYAVLYTLTVIMKSKSSNMFYPSHASAMANKLFFFLLLSFFGWLVVCLCEGHMTNVPQFHFLPLKFSYNLLFFLLRSLEQNIEKDKQ